MGGLLGAVRAATQRHLAPAGGDRDVESLLQDLQVFVVTPKRAFQPRLGKGEGYRSGSDVLVPPLRRKHIGGKRARQIRSPAAPGL